MATMTRKALPDLRKQLAADIRAVSIPVARRFEALGAAGPVKAARARLRALESGKPVTVTGTSLADALYTVGDVSASGRVERSDVAVWTVDPAGGYAPA